MELIGNIDTMHGHEHLMYYLIWHKTQMGEPDLTHHVCVDAQFEARLPIVVSSLAIYVLTFASQPHMLHM